MTQKQEQILNTAAQMFIRYGFRRTTMGDVAADAQMSRQSLYEYYSSKEQLLGGVIEYYNLNLIETLKEEWSHKSDLSDKLDIFFLKAVIEMYRLMQQWPDAGDIITDDNIYAKNAYNTGLNRLTKLIEEPLTKHKAAIEKTHQTVAQFARFIVITAMKLKKNTESEKELKMLLHSLKVSIIAVVEAS